MSPAIFTNWQAGHLYIQMLRFAKSGLLPDLRNRLVGDIPNPRMIANSVVRLNGSFDRCSAFRKKKK